MSRHPLILLPGLLCTADLWRHQTDGLSDIADIRVADLTRRDDIAAMAEDVLAEAPPRFALAGLSMGGYVAQEIMRRAAWRVDRLALLNTTPAADTEEATRRRRLFIALARDDRFGEATAQTLDLLIAESRRGDADLVATFERMARTVGRDGFVRQQTAIMGRPDGTADLARIACPTLIVAGRQDTLTPPAVHEAMAAAIPGARLEIIEDCGHLSTLERPREVSAAMRGWLQA